MRDPFTRGFPEDLPVRPATSAHFDWKAHSRNLFDLRLPENLTSQNTGRIIMPIRQEVALDWHWHKRFLESRLHVKGLIGVTARIIPGVDRVYLALEAENQSRENWIGVEASVCLRLISAPDFADRKRERTSWWDGTGWKPLETGFPQHKLGTSPSQGFIAAESEPPGFVVGTGWESVNVLGGNDQLHNICIHADPLLGDIAAGEAVKARGMIVFIKGNRGDALQFYLYNQNVFPAVSE